MPSPFRSVLEMSMSMIDIYYGVWADCIARMREIQKSEDDWVIKCLFYMTICMAFNLLFVMLIMQRYILGKYFYTLNVPILPKQLNYLFNFALLYFLPCLVFNYLLMLRKNRYVKILENHPYRGGRLFATYLVISIAVPTIFILLFF